MYQVMKWKWQQYTMTLGITLCPDKNTDFFPLEKAKMGNENGEYRSWNDNFLGLKIPIPRELN